MTKSFRSFSDTARAMNEVRANDSALNIDRDTRETYDGAFIEAHELAKLNIVDTAEKLDMPDPDQAAAAVDLMLRTMFDVFRDTRMEEFAADLAWGFVNSFHMVSKRIEGRADDAAKKLKDMVNEYDPSEIYAVELEDTQLLCQTLDGCSEAMACMRDHAGEVFRSETGRPFNTVRGSRVSSKLTASVIDGKDFLAARAAKRREEHNPTGPVVAFSGGQVWHDHEQLFDRLDQIKRRIPAMVLMTTGMNKGADAVAAAWASSRGTKLVRMDLERRFGHKAAFLRNDRIASFRPVEAIVCEGSGVQSDFARKLRNAGVPLHVFRLADQRPMTPTTTTRRA
ncbi:MAG: hypothetical protein DI613_20560 [Kocuria rhizophila]|uniref:SLOG family protein n=1 Tax=Sphingomonas sp. BE138 TaxID=2817845 RepID=UPI000DB5F3D1|nr:SLOG family protein [Sphingomonas sp. BE138]MDR6790854.1 hypothetical protein [Sphingomonas sp. BE138]PZO71829.1 MAG: hypothetical protein DI629_21270 [Mesorhizobium amorphae]PZP20088.1 MAG: hypothetical protein DI613_20560 [Kocuria rhizophila]PZU13555.1 MAG: hypothetical protein DI591_13120 [Citromicrobium sp.]